MALTKEQILTLTCLKEVDVKGVGPQKIFAIGATIDDRGLEIKSYEDLAQLMSGMKEKAINKVTLSNLNDAYKVARKIMDASDQANIGLVGYYDEEFPDVLRKTVNEEGKLDPPLLLWYRGDFSVTRRIGDDENKKALWTECSDKIEYMLKPFGKGGDGFTTFWL